MEDSAESSEPQQAATDPGLSPTQERELLDAHREIQAGFYVDAWDLLREIKVSLNT